MIKARCFAALCALVLLVTPVASAGQNGAKAQAQAPKELTDADVSRLSVDELILMLAKKKPVLIIDVRAPDTYTEIIKGAIQIPWDQIGARLKEIPRNKEIVTYCAWPSEHTSAGAAITLLQKGYKKVHALKGGWHMWLQAAGPIEQKK